MRLAAFNLFLSHSLHFPLAASPSKRPLAPGDGHGGRSAVAVAALVFGAVFEPGDEADELLDRLFIDLATFLFGGQLGFA